mgnify:FL=1|jgi:hypothetical protein
MLITSNQLLRGDPLAPDAFDLIAQFAMLNVGDPVPPDGWRVLSGNMHHSEIVRVVLRHEEEAEDEPV